MPLSAPLPIERVAALTGVAPADIERLIAGGILTPRGADDGEPHGRPPTADAGSKRRRHRCGERGAGGGRARARLLAETHSVSSRVVRQVLRRGCDRTRPRPGECDALPHGHGSAAAAARPHRARGRGAAAGGAGADAEIQASRKRRSSISAASSARRRAPSAPPCAISSAARSRPCCSREACHSTI